MMSDLLPVIPNRSDINSSLGRNLVPVIQIQADLYSILQTAKILQDRYLKGGISPDFYYRRMKQFHRELIAIQLDLNQRGKTLGQLATKMPVLNEMQPIIAMLSALGDISFNEIARDWHVDGFQLATTATEITSNFITLLDYLRLISIPDWEFLLQLTIDLRISLEKMETFYPILAEVRINEQEVRKLVLHAQNEKELEKQTKSFEVKHLEDTFYQLYLTFKHYLNVK
jgi:hypothetical protein